MVRFSNNLVFQCRKPNVFFFTLHFLEKKKLLASWQNGLPPHPLSLYGLLYIHSLRRTFLCCLSRISLLHSFIFLLFLTQAAFVGYWEDQSGKPLCNQNRLSNLSLAQKWGFFPGKCFNFVFFWPFFVVLFLIKQKHPLFFITTPP